MIRVLDTTKFKDLLHLIGSFCMSYFLNFVYFVFFYALHIFYVTISFIRCLCHNNEEMLKTTPNLTCLLIISISSLTFVYTKQPKYMWVVRIKDIIWRITGLFFADIMNHFDTYSLNLFDFVITLIYLSFFTTSLISRWNLISKLRHHVIVLCFVKFNETIYVWSIDFLLTEKEFLQGNLSHSKCSGWSLDLIKRWI